MDDPSRMLTDRIAAFRVLASGSGGNCSVLVVRGLNGPRVILIDAGLSPRRTRRVLEHMGLTFDAIDSVLITHLDHDHWKPNWATALPGHSTIHLHRSHARRGRYQGLSSESARVRVFDHPLELMPGVRADPFSSELETTRLQQRHVEQIVHHPREGVRRRTDSREEG